MRFTEDFQFAYLDENRMGTVSQRNLRDYFLVIERLPKDLQKSIHDINEDNEVFHGIQVGDYMFSPRYEKAIEHVNAFLAKHHRKLSHQKNLWADITKTLHDDYEDMSTQGNFAPFYDSIHQLLSNGQEQEAIYRLIGRYGVHRVDRYFNDELMVRDDLLHYSYIGTDADDRMLDDHHGDIEEVMYRGEFGRFPVLPDDDTKYRAKTDYTKRIVRLWKNDQQDKAIRTLSNDYRDVWDTTLADLSYRSVFDLVHLLRHRVQEENQKITFDKPNDNPMSVVESPLEDYIGKMKDVAQESSLDSRNLWHVGKEPLKAYPLNATDIVGLIEELQERKDEE